MVVNPKWRLGKVSAFSLASGDIDSARDYLARQIEKVAQGEHAALEEVYKLTSAKLYALLLRMLPQAAADEVLQDVYLTVWRRADAFDARIASPITWLVTIARNKAIDRLRSDKPGLRSRSLQDAAMHLPDPAPSSLANLERNDEVRRLQQCLDELDSSQRDLIRDAFFSGMTYQQMSEARGVPLGTMKSWIRRNLQRLRKCLEQ